LKIGMIAEKKTPVCTGVCFFFSLERSDKAAGGGGGGDFFGAGGGKTQMIPRPGGRAESWGRGG